MNYEDIISVAAGLVQVLVALYALRLNRLFHVPRVGWCLFSAFTLMAGVQLFGVWQAGKAPLTLDFGMDAVHLVISLLLLVGMTHIESVMKERVRAEAGLERRVKERTTELEKTHVQLRQAQKMEAVGQLAGGVAHDFNNILTVIMGYSQLLLMNSSNGHSKEQLEGIYAAAERAAGLVRQLLAFSRRQVLQTKPLDLNELISNITKMLRRLIGEDIVLESSYAPGLPLVAGDAGMIEQVIMNLAVNARDAMTKGGVLSIATSKVEVSDTYVMRKNEEMPGSFICMTVRDTGSGMSPQVMEHLFEPFFTTKEIGKGTGLGLATVYGIVKQHNGWIEVDSKHGEGTEFKIFFPSAPKSALPRLANTGEAPKQLHGKETILLVEDEEPVRRFVRLLLNQHGYRVFEADCGASAQDVWEQQRDSIDLLLTDMVMPGGMNGRELADKLKAKNPRLRVVFTSGYSPSRSGHDTKILDGLKFLPKPYHPDKLLECVRESLDADVVK